MRQPEDCRRKRFGCRPRALSPGGQGAPFTGVTTVVFQPNSREGAYPENPDLMRYVARAGGAFGDNSDLLDDGPWYTNATTPSWYSGSPDVMVVGMAREVDIPATDKRWRGLMRFVLGEVVLDQSSIKSGPTPQASWWPLVVAARLKFYVIGAGAPEANPAVPLFTTSDLRIRYEVDNNFYSPVGDENPMGDSAEAQASFQQAFNFAGPEAHTIPWADWGASAATLVTIDLPQIAIDNYLKQMPNIFPPGKEHLEIALILEHDLAEEDLVNFKVEIAAWGVNQPTLEIDFDLS